MLDYHSKVLDYAFPFYNSWVSSAIATTQVTPQVLLFSENLTPLVTGRPRFGSVTVRGWKRFERFRFSVPAVPLQKKFLCVSVQFNRK